jgi:hypothetical protein
VPRIAPRFLSACRLAPEQNVAADCLHRSEYPERVKVAVIHMGITGKVGGATGRALLAAKRSVRVVVREQRRESILVIAVPNLPEHTLPT